jgi:hypothetical protein
MDYLKNNSKMRTPPQKKPKNEEAFQEWFKIGEIENHQEWPNFQNAPSTIVYSNKNGRRNSPPEENARCFWLFFINTTQV